MKKTMIFLSLFFIVLSILTRVLSVNFYDLQEWGIYLFLAPIVYSLLMIFKKRDSSLKIATWFTLGCSIPILLTRNFELMIVGCKLIALFLGWLIMSVLDIIYNKKYSK